MTDPFAPAPIIAAPQALPAPAEAGSRQLMATIIWEAVLLVAAVVAAAVVFLGGPRPPLGLFLSGLTTIGLLAVAVALSLRTATVNLAVGALAVLAGSLGVSLTNNDMPMLVAMAIGVGAATLAGLLLGIVAAALSVPAWAVTLGGATIIEAVVLALTGSQIQVLRANVGPLSEFWFGFFALLTLAGGALWLIPGLRTALSATRDIAPAGRFGGMRPGLGAIVGITGSGFVAGLAGVAYALRLHASPTPSGTSLTLLGLAVALLGGVSAFGRRGGIAGVLLATIVLGSMQHILIVNRAPSWVVLLTTGVAVLIGLAATRLIETLTQPRQ